MLAGRFQVQVGSATRAALIVGLAASIAVMCTSPALAAPPAKKKSGTTQLTVSPRKPKATDGLSIAFRAGKLRRDERYLVNFESQGAGTNVQCTGSYQVLVIGRKRPRQLVELTLYPNQVLATSGTAHFFNAAETPSARRFCAGATSIWISRIDPDGKVNFIASRHVRIARDARYPEPTGTPVKIGLLEGSSIKVEAPGRPDRTLSVTGTLHGVIPSTFTPNTNIDISSMTGAMYLTSISPDALCAGPTYRVELGLAQGGPSKMLLEASGNSVLSLELLADPLSLAGCAAPAAPGKSTLTLAGRVNPPDGLIRLPLSGTIKDVQIAAGLPATVTLNLLVKVDLSGRT